MSASITSNRKKKLKGKQASLIPVRNNSQTKQKKKTSLTRKYQEIEKEVQMLLEKTNLATNSNISDSKKTDFDTESVKFFCSDNQHFSNSSTKDFLKPADEVSSVDDNEDDDDNDDDNESYKTTSSQSLNDAQDPASDKRIPSHSEHSTSTHGGNQTASTFIQIEGDHDNCMQYRIATKHQFNNKLLFKPSTSVHPYGKFEMSTANSNTKRMVNRYHEQAKATDEKLTNDVVNALQLVQKDSDPVLYRTFCLHEFHPIFCDATPNIIEIPTRQFVKIFIKDIRFTRHPQLCEEHTLANELDDLYEEYLQKKVKRIGEELNTSLQIERKIVSALMRQAEEKDTDEHHFRKLQEHLFKIKELRTRLYAEEAHIKSLLKQILDKWLQLKKLRKSQEFQCTRFKLCIKIPELSKQTIEKARIEWEKRFQTDLSETYREELETYYSAKRAFKAEPIDVSKTSNRMKPKKPSLTRVSAELNEKYCQSFYMPEEPQIEITRSRISDEEFYENTTKIARNGSQLRKLRSFFIRIHLDSEFVADSRSYRLEPDLSLSINEAIGVVLERRRPKKIKMVLFEKSKLSAPNKVATIIVAFPSTSTTYQESSSAGEFSMQNISFTSKKEPIEGRLCMGVQCQNQIAENNISMQIPCQLPTDNEEILTSHRGSSDDDENKQPSLFGSETCTFEESLLQFCNLEDLKSNARFKLLRSRYLKHDDRTRNLCLIPALENELELDSDCDEEPIIETGCWMDPIDLHKHYGKNYLRNLYEAIRNQCSRLDCALENTENLLIGDEPGNWSLLLDAISGLFRPGRPLNPARSSTIKTIHASALDWNGSQNFNVVLNVVRATGVPVRYTENIPPNFDKNSSPRNTFISTNLKYSNVRPFISFSYKDKICRTTTAEGSNPTWNEQLVLQLSGSLKELREDLKISLFDEIIERQMTTDELSNARNMEIFQRVQTNWLGEYRIPIGTLLQQHRIEGNAELNVPKVLVGYKRPTLDSIATNSETHIIVEIKESVQLYFYLSVEPKFEVPRTHTNSLECSELREVRQKLHEWSILVKEVQPHRFVEPLVCTEDGKRVCLTRLLEPIPLPIKIDENLMEHACRYVSLLSTLKYFDPLMGFSGVWLSNQTLLDTTWGSAKDFGVLLCNYMLAIGLKCWLALGISNTFGEVTFAMVSNEEGHLHFIEPYTGKSYSLKDILCPLKKIYCVIARDNIFCNVQVETRVPMMNFNFNDTSCWLPAFNKRSPAPLGGVQKLNYTYHDSLNTSELMKNIERKIMKKITSWRTMQKTIWNRAFQPCLQKILLGLETMSMRVNNNVHEELQFVDQIHQEFPNYKIYGYALNFPYTNLSAISERIRTTSIHLNSDQNVEFSLAVHAHVWPNDVLSIWMFLISAVPFMNI